MNKWLEIHQKACQAIIDGCDSQIKAGNYVEHMEACRDMWAWLLDNPGRSKTEYIKTILFGDQRLFGPYECAACVAVNVDCDVCPLKEVWGEAVTCLNGAETPYALWRTAIFWLRMAALREVGVC